MLYYVGRCQISNLLWKQQHKFIHFLTRFKSHSLFSGSRTGGTELFVGNPFGTESDDCKTIRPDKSHRPVNTKSIVKRNNVHVSSCPSLWVTVLNLHNQPVSEITENI